MTFLKFNIDSGPHFFPEFFTCIATPKKSSGEKPNLIFSFHKWDFRKSARNEKFG